MLKESDFEKMLVWDNGDDIYHRVEAWVYLIRPDGSCYAITNPEIKLFPERFDGGAPWDNCKPIQEKRLMTRDEAMDLVAGDQKKRVRIKHQPWMLPGPFMFLDEIDQYEWCDRENGEYGHAYKFEVVSDD